MLNSFDKYSKTKCGYASVKLSSFKAPKKVDQMETFFLSETLKYLYLLYDDDNWLLREIPRGRESRGRKIILSTEAHLLWIPEKIKRDEL